MHTNAGRVFDLVSLVQIVLSPTPILFFIRGVCKVRTETNRMFAKAKPCVPTFAIVLPIIVLPRLGLIPKDVAKRCMV